jgi:tripartite-type tricarboxylate transporter receptor subunit TctC
MCTISAPCEANCFCTSGRSRIAETSLCSRSTIGSGVPGYQAANWIGVVTTAGTPEPIVGRLHKEVAAILDTPEVQKQFASQGADIVHMSTAEFGAFSASEIVKWGRVVKTAGIKAQ